MDRPLEAFTGSSHGWVSDVEVERASGGGEDLRDSNSFAMDFSPDHGLLVMNSLSSGDSGLHDWTNVNFDPTATSPMSFNMSETSIFGTTVEGIGDQFRSMEHVNTSRTSSVNDLSEGLQQQIFDGRRSLFQAATQHVPTTTMSSGASQGGGWPSYSGSTTLNLISPDIVLEEPPSSYTTQSSYEPWSFEGQRRYHGFAKADAPVFGPHTDFMHDMASWASSPKMHDISTPSSTRSPSFPHATLDQDALRPIVSTTRPTLHLQVDRTLRQNSFHAPRSSPIVPQAVHSSTPTVSHKPCQSNFNINLSQSPGGDFVFVPLPSQDSPSQCGAIESETLKSETVQVEHAPSPQISPQAKHDPSYLIFGPQTFLADDSNNNRVSSGGLVQRKHSAGSGKRLGGRPVGSHLAPDKAARTKQMREEGSCWLCCLQRDSCTPGEVCDRCIKRNQRATLEHGIGCDRTKLTELKSVFIPEVITRLHEFQTLKDFCAEHIKRWKSVSITLEFNVIWTLPPITCEVYEFEPKTRELLRQFQYIQDPHSERRVRVEKASPPLAMLAIEQADRHKYDRYLTMIVDKYLEPFAELVYDYQSDDFSLRLLRLMVGFKPDNKEESSLLREVHRLLVCTHIMCRTATISKSQTPLLYQLHSHPPNPNAYADSPSPRMANRQLKYLFCALQQQILDSILKKLQQVLRSSKGPQKWTAAFISLLGLAMSFELVQRLVHTLMDAEAAMGNYSVRDADYIAEVACLAIDENFAFVRNLFRWKYHRGFNPLKEVEQENVKEVLGEKGVEFVRGIVALIMEKHDSFLFDRQYVSISTQNHHKYTSRLVARFLLPFWSPQ